MRPYFKLPDLVALVEGVLTLVKGPQQDYDHNIPKLEDAITRVNRILSIYPKPNDKFVYLFSQSTELHHVLFEIIDINNQRELNSSTNAAKDFALKSDAVDQWTQA